MAENQGQPLPTVSVIVLNYNGKHHLETCLPSLLELRYPKDILELIVVDNGSTDGSLEYVEEHFPTVRIVRNPENYGFAKGNNIGAQQASGRYVAFLNNDSRVDPAWVAELVKPLAGPGIVCCASKILSWDGQRVDFVGSKLNFYGYGFQIDYGAPYVEELYNEEKLLPAACGGAMLIDRNVFLDCGGFDEDFFAYFEDIDLGWRLWVLGYSVVFAPRAIAYHKHHGTSGFIPEHRLRVIFERNSLFTLFKNYEQDNLNRLLPLALLLSAKRGLHDTMVEPGDFARPNGKQGGALNGVPKLGLACLLAMDEFVASLPRLQEKRQWIQERRKRSDDEIFRRFGRWVNTPVIYTPSFLAAQDTLVKNFDVPAFLRQPQRSVLLITHDVISEKMAGPGMRYWEIARVLSKDFLVTLAAPGQPRLSSPNFHVRGYQRSDAASIAPLVKDADMVFAFGFVLHQFPLLQSLDKPLAVDIYDPFTLEDLEVYSDRPLPEQAQILQAHTGALNHQLSTGDFFVCASERQRDYWMGMLTANNRINPATYSQDPTLRKLIDVVAFGLPSTPPAQTRQVMKGVVPGIGTDDHVLLWGGGIWQWFDPLTLIRAVALIAATRSDVKLVFMGKQHFDTTTVPATPIAAQAVRLSEELGVLGRSVFFNDWTDYGDRQNYLLEADIGVSLHLNNIETRFAFRTRMMDYIWAGLPIVTTEGDCMSEVVERYGLGKVVPCQDEDALVTALLQLLDTPNLRDAYRPRFERVAAEYTWEKVTEPLVAWCRNPQRAADKLGAAGLPMVRQTPPVPATPVWRLPVKALHHLGKGGLKGLTREIQSYIRWKTADR